jgi:hypothetical protein
VHLPVGEQILHGCRRAHGRETVFARAGILLGAGGDGLGLYPATLDVGHPSGIENGLHA